MIKLEKEFLGVGEVKGFKFTQIEESEKGYIYKVETELNEIHYEVFKKVITNKYDFENKKSLDIEMESYPRSARFGVNAWNVNSLERANEILTEINKTKEEKEIDKEFDKLEKVLED